MKFIFLVHITRTKLNKLKINNSFQIHEKTKVTGKTTAPQLQIDKYGKLQFYPSGSIYRSQYWERLNLSNTLLEDQCGQV